MADMPLGPNYVDMYPTPTDMDPSDPLGQLAGTIDPPGLYIFTSAGYVAVGSPSETAPPSPASEAGQGTGVRPSGGGLARVPGKRS